MGIPLPWLYLLVDSLLCESLSGDSALVSMSNVIATIFAVTFEFRLEAASRTGTATAHSDKQKETRASRILKRAMVLQGNYKIIV